MGKNKKEIWGPRHRDLAQEREEGKCQDNSCTADLNRNEPDVKGGWQGFKRDSPGKEKS